MKKQLPLLILAGALVAGGGAYYFANKTETTKLPQSTSLIEAAFDGRADEVTRLLALGSKIDDRNERKQTPLIAAIVGGHPEVAGKLLEAGADAKVEDERGLTPLHYAAANNHLDLVKAIIAKGGDINKANGEGFTPYNLAKAYRSKTTMDYLASIGAKTDPLPPKKKAKAKERMSAGPGGG